MKPTLAIIAAMLAATCSRADWTIDEITDEMTDEKSYFVVCNGTPIQEVGYRPALVFKVTPKKKTATGGMVYAGDFMLSIETDAFRRNADDLQLRFNRDKPIIETWNSSTDRHALFSPDWKGMFRRLSASTNLTVRYATTLGHVRTTKFDTQGLTNAIRQVRLRYTAKKAAP